MPSINLSGLRNISRLKALLAEGQPIDLFNRKCRIGRIIPQSIKADYEAGKWPEPPEESLVAGVAVHSDFRRSAIESGHTSRPISASCIIRFGGGPSSC